MKQTAVEWLVNELTMLGHNFKLYNREINQAKQMEKEQKEHIWIAAIEYSLFLLKDKTSKDSKASFEQYYNETYGGNNHIGEANEMV